MAADNRKPFTLRLDEDTMDALRTIARLEERTMNGLIEEIIQRGLPDRIDEIEGELSRTLDQVRSLRRDPPTPDNPIPGHEPSP